jgi:peptidyl-tRNA hydrolase, PTH1 family
LLTIVGLGNPGAAYRHTRHNAGYMLLESISEGIYLKDAEFCQSGTDTQRFLSTGGKFKKTTDLFVGIKGFLAGKDFFLVKPLTYMNESGSAIKSLFSKGIIKDISELLVIFDDVDINLGIVKIREKGSAAGHNGLKSIIDIIGTNEFQRLRIGIGPRPDGSEIVDYVLGKFTKNEYEIFGESLCKSSIVLENWIKDGFTGAQKALSKSTSKKKDCCSTL